MKKETKEQKKRQEIRQLAYKLYVERGRIDGYDRDDWKEAKSIMRWMWFDWVAVIVLILFLIFFLTFSADTGRTLEFLFLAAIGSVIYVTAYTTIRKNVNDGLFRALRAVFHTLLALVPLMVFVSSNWPAIGVVGVEMPNYQRTETNDGGVLLPEMARFQLKNYSKVAVRDLELKYWLVSGQEGDSEERCTLDFSASNEIFAFGSEEGKFFNFSFGKLAKKSTRDLHVHHLFLLVQMRYRPHFFWPLYEKVWSVLYFAPEKGEWVAQRKNHHYWKPHFQQWQNWLDQGRQAFPICSEIP